jgi:hypothetical protein
MLTVKYKRWEATLHKVDHVTVIDTKSKGGKAAWVGYLRSGRLTSAAYGALNRSLPGKTPDSEAKAGIARLLSSKGPLRSAGENAWLAGNAGYYGPPRAKGKAAKKNPASEWLNNGRKTLAASTKATIRRKIDRYSVGLTPAEAANKMIGEANPGAPAWFVTAAKKYAREVHTKARRDYNDIMGGRVGSLATKRSKRPKGHKAGCGCFVCKKGR